MNIPLGFLNGCERLMTTIVVVDGIEGLSTFHNLSQITKSEEPIHLIINELR